MGVATGRPWALALGLAAWAVQGAASTMGSQAVPPLHLQRKPLQAALGNQSLPRGLRGADSLGGLKGGRIPVEIGQVFAIVMTITVGSPAQEFRCLLDSGSADLWLPSKRCRSCTNQRYYDADASSTFSPKLVRTQEGDVPQKIMVEFGSGRVSGFAVQDGVGFGPFQLQDHAFMLVEDADIPQHPDWDGICGLSWTGMAQTGSPFYERLQESGRRALFTLVPTGGSQAALVIGEAPEEEGLAWAPIVRFDGEDRQRFWLIQGTVAPGSQASRDVRLVVDTGTNGVLMVPPQQFDQFIEELMPPQAISDGSCFRQQNALVCDCSLAEMEGEPLRLELGGRVFEMPFQKLFVRVPQGGGRPDACIPLVYASPIGDVVDHAAQETHSTHHEALPHVTTALHRRRLLTMYDAWVLGGSFLEVFVVAFDFDNFRVGFADPPREAESLVSMPVLSRAQVTPKVRTPIAKSQPPGLSPPLVAAVSAAPWVAPVVAAVFFWRSALSCRGGAVADCGVTGPCCRKSLLRRPKRRSPSEVLAAWSCASLSV